MTATVNVTGCTTDYAETAGPSFAGSGSCYDCGEVEVIDFWIYSATHFVMGTSSRLQYHEIPF